MPSFSQKLAQLMRNQGLGNRALAEHLGISHPPVGEWLKGKSMPRPEQIKKLADYFEVTVDDLLEDSRELPPAVQPERPARSYAPEQRASMQAQLDEYKVKKAKHEAVLKENKALSGRMKLSAILVPVIERTVALLARVAGNQEAKEAKPELNAILEDLTPHALPDWWSQVPTLEAWESLGSALPDVYRRLETAAMLLVEGDNLASHGKRRRPEHEHPLVDAFHDLKLPGTHFMHDPSRSETLFRCYMSLLQKHRAAEVRK